MPKNHISFNFRGARAGAEQIVLSGLILYKNGNGDLPGALELTREFSGVLVAQPFVFYVVFCRLKLNFGKGIMTETWSYKFHSKVFNNEHNLYLIKSVKWYMWGNQQQIKIKIDR